MSDIPNHQIRAVYDTSTIRVYQAYSDAVANAALARGTFVSPPFKMDRMTWIKPSFLWMMYRAGWGLKDAGQTRILAIDISREGFEWALHNSCLSDADPGATAGQWSSIKASSPVRIQWDPERNLALHRLAYRSIQIGLSKQAVDLYVNQWIRGITDIGEQVREIHELVRRDKMDAAQALLPNERPYPLSPELARHLDSHPFQSDRA